MGINSATVHAAYVGSYVWAKMGYSATPDEMKKVDGAFRKYLEEQGVKRAEPFTSVKQIAEFAAGDAKHGKDFLLKLGEDGGIQGWHGQGWHGELKIDRADPGYQAMNHYLGRT